MATIGIDHVQFSVPELSASTAFMEGLGWSLDFSEANFAPTARPYFRETGKSMAFLKRGRAAIELINASPRKGPGSWMPIFSSRLPGETSSAGPAPGGEVDVRAEPLGGTCRCIDVLEDDAELCGVILSSAEPEASATFLESLGFRRDAEGEGINLSYPPSIVGMGLAVHIVAGPPLVERAYVDDLGLSLIAMLVTDLEAVVGVMNAAGHGTTDIFDYQINARSISNAVVHGPGGELIELLQIGRA